MNNTNNESSPLEKKDTQNTVPPVIYIMYAALIIVLIAYILLYIS